MALQTFSFPLPETRLFKADGVVYKFNIRGGGSYSGKEVIRENYIHQELEDIIRAVLANLDSLQPFSTAHFIVFPYKRPWETVSKLVFEHGKNRLTPYPFTISVYLENNAQGKDAEKDLTSETEAAILPSEPLPKRTRTDSPLERIILQNIFDKYELNNPVYIAGRTCDGSVHAEEAAKGGDQDKKGTETFAEPLPAGVNIHVATAEEELHFGQADEGEEEANMKEASSPVRPGMLTWLASHIFPFFKKT